MSEKTGDKKFQHMAIGLMALTGLATLLHAIHGLYRDLKPKPEPHTSLQSARFSQTAVPLEEPQLQATAQHHDHSWVHRARVSKPRVEGTKTWVQLQSRSPNGWEQS
jgi:hypothetical protein